MAPIEMEFSLVGIHDQQDNRPHNIATIDKVEPPRCDVTISIKKMLKELPPINTKCSIYRVPKRLVETNETAYTPRVISIGPFHNRRQDLMVAEQHKLRGLSSYLNRLNMKVEDAMVIARRWEKKARRCYAEPINMNSDDFVKMMLIDGCFIVEYILIVQDFYLETSNGLDPLFYKALGPDINRDLTMLENQLPFFVLRDLFDQLPNYDLDSFAEHMAQLFFGAVLKKYKLPPNISPHKVHHLVHLLRLYYVPSREEHKKDVEIKKKFLLPPTVTELREAGVKVREAEKVKSLMDISFKDGVLKIPPFKIYDNFETYVRNLMAFELYWVGDQESYILHYVMFLDGLINTEKDVSLLVKEKIIANYIGGSHKEVSKLFNNLCINSDGLCNFYYYGTSRDLHDYCKKRRHRWMALLRHNYFNSPWSYISFVAATFLILFTFLQPLFSALSSPNN